MASPSPPPRLHRGVDPFRGRRWTALVVLVDALALGVALTVAVRLHVRGPVPAGGQVLGLVLALGTVLQLASRGTYDARTARTSRLDVVRQVVNAHAAGLAGSLALAALVAPAQQTTSTLVVAAALGVGLVLLGRSALFSARRRARRAGRSGSRVIIVGAGEVGAELERRLLERPALGLHPVGFLDADPSPGFRDRGARTPVLGSPADLARVASETGADVVVFAHSRARDHDLLPLVRQAQRIGLRVSIVPRLFEAIGARTHVDHVGGMPLVVTRQTLPHEWPFLVKHTVGRAAAVGVAAAGLPLLAVLAVAVRLSSPGPILYRHRRVGRDGRNFDLYKLRTMRVADPVEVAAAALAGAVGVGNGPGGVEGIDRRTRVGTFLRRTSLDELPQLLNVVQGHMSLVGPRPERPEWVARFGSQVRGYDDRHRVKSGMTGWAQVNGLRGQTSIAERIELDNWYVQNWSLWLDIKILLMTPVEVLRSRAEASTGGAASATEAHVPTPALLATLDEVELPPGAAEAIDEHLFRVAR